MLQASILFQDHMVLQRDKQVAVWGTADAGKRITVAMQGKTSDAVTGADGKWEVICGPYSASFAEKMTITSGEEELELQDVQVGEVWLAGGQSNMEFHMRYDADMAEEVKICTNHNIRFFDYPEVAYVGQIDEADYRKYYGFWRKAEPEQLERFSAVGYYFAKDLQKRYDVPIGIIGCNWGGSPACAWMSEEAILEGGGKVYLDEYEEAIKDLDMEEYEAAFRRNREIWPVDQLAGPIGDKMMFGASEEEMDALFQEMGLDPTDPEALGPLIGPKYERRPCGLYESMLQPIVPYGIRGVIWYQGETDGDCHPEIYKTLFPALIRNWRQLWGEELPFLFVQIEPLDRWMQCVGEPYVEIRAAQQHTADTVPNTGMAVTTDVGMQTDIHPKKKQPVGHRLALLAQNMVYGEDVLCEAPTLSKIQVEAGKIVLAFEHAGEGLYLTGTMPHGQAVDPGKLGGLQVFQDGRELDAASLYARAEGCQVTVMGDEIRPGVPTQVKLARTGWCLVNLYNSAGIPARPAQAAV